MRCRARPPHLSGIGRVWRSRTTDSRRSQRWELSNRATRFGAVIALIFLGSQAGYAQVPISGKLAGTVQNEARLPQANVTVQLRFKGAAGPGTTGLQQVRTAITDSNGLFLIDQVEPGIYEVAVASPLFEPLRQDIEILTAKAKMVEIILGRQSRVASIQELDIDRGFKAEVISTVEYQLGTRVREPVVNTREGVLGGSFEPGRITALPLDGRNYLDLLKLQPGVFDKNGGEGFGAFNGARATSQNFTLDGTENTDADLALPSLFEDGAVALDSIQEFRVLTSNANAEYGRNSGGQVSLFIKRSGNDFHGLLYEYFTYDRFNARNFFDLNPQFEDRGFKPPDHRHQFGWNLGGPLLEDRHFFFSSYEGFRNSQGLPRSPLVPTVGVEDGVNLLLNRLIEDFRFRRVDQQTGLPVGGPSPLLLAAFLRASPAPTRRLIRAGGSRDPDVGIFDTTIPLDNDTDSFILRTDHQLRDDNRLHIRYALSDGDESIVGNGLPGTGAGKDFRSQNVSIVDTHIINESQVNEFRFGFSRNRVDFPTAETPAEIQSLRDETLHEVIPTIPQDPLGRTFGDIYPDIGFGADNSRVSGFPFFIFPNRLFANLGVDSLNFPQGRARNTFQFGDTYSFVKRRHAIRAGADIRRLQQNSISGFSLRPSFILRDIGSADGLFVDQIFGGRQNFFFSRECGAGDLQACAADDVDGDGLPDGPIIRGLRSTEYGFFVQENFKIWRRLTLDAGLRYEIFGRESEADDFFSRAVSYSFVPFTQDGTLAPGFAVNQFGPGIGSTVRDADLNNFGPRLGIAWDPFGDGKTALRAAYGIYYDHIHGTTVFPSQLNPPGVLSFMIPRDVVLEDGLTVAFSPRLGQVPVRIAPGALFRVDDRGRDILDADGNRLTFPLPLNLVDPNLRDPSIQRWNVTIQRELDKDTFVEVSYVGSKGTHLLRARLPNLGAFIIDARALGIYFPEDGAFRRPNQDFGAISVQESSAASSFHSLQLQVQRRLSRGLAFQAAYTVSKSFDDASSNVVDAGAGGSVFPGNSFDLSPERGLSAFDVRQRLVINYVYDLPFGPGRRFLGAVQAATGKLLEGWSISGIAVFQTGFPLTLLAGYDVNEDGVFNDRPFLVPGRSLDELLVPGGGENGNTRFFRDPRGGDGVFCNIDPDGPSTDPLVCSNMNNIVTPGRVRFFLDTGFFDLPPLYGRFSFDTLQFNLRGDLLRPFDPNLQLGRGIFTGPGRRKVDFALRKITRLDGLRQGMAIEFRAEFFNLFNHTNFADPEVNIISPRFGEIRATSTPARRIQFALKLSF